MTSWRVHALVIGLYLAVPLGALLTIAWWPEARPPTFAVSCTPEPPTEDDQLVADTYPPRWSVGQSWIVEIEEDRRPFYATPSRRFARYLVAHADDEHWVIEVNTLNRPRKYFVVRREPFYVTRPDAAVHVPKPPAVAEVFPWGEVFEFSAADLLPHDPVRMDRPSLESAPDATAREGLPFIHGGGWRPLSPPLHVRKMSWDVAGFWDRRGLVFALGPPRDHTRAVASG